MGAGDGYMFKIGEVASIYGISIRALRLYDRIGLFRPDYVDEKTGYRYYTPDQLYILNAIIELKELGCSLEEVASVVREGLRPDMMLQLLNQKEKQWKDTLIIASHRLNQVKETRRRIRHSMKCRVKRRAPEPDSGMDFHMARLVALGDTKVSSTLSEVLWL